QTQVVSLPSRPTLLLSSLAKAANSKWPIAAVNDAELRQVLFSLQRRAVLCRLLGRRSPPAIDGRPSPSERFARFEVSLRSHPNFQRNKGVGRTIDSSVVRHQPLNGMSH